MRKLVTLIIIVVVGFGIVFSQFVSFSLEGHEKSGGGSQKSEANIPSSVLKPQNEINLDEAPRIAFENPNHDFGTIYTGEKVEHLFKFENRGKADLVIKNVKTSCGCTAAATSKENIPPGGFGEIKATFNPGQHPGKAKKEITVTTNDPVKLTVSLSITANIVQEAIVKPQWINFGIITKGETSAKTVEISPGTDFNLEVTGVESNVPNVTASYKRLENGKDYIVDAVMKSDAPIGKLKGNIIVTTNSKRQAKVAIPFSGDIAGDVHVSQSVLSYGIVQQGKESVRKLIVTLRKKDVDIKDIETTPTFLSAVLQPKANSDLPYREVEVKLKDDAPVGKINGNIKIHTTSESQPTIEIPVFGEVRGFAAKKG